MSCYNTTVVNAPIADVWRVLSDFHNMSWAAGVIEHLEVVGDVSARQVGAKRILNGVFKETLRALDSADHTFEYSIDDGPGPVSKDGLTGYVGSVRLSPVTDRNATFVEWKSRWESAEGDVAEFCNPIYQAFLQALSKHFE